MKMMIILASGPVATGKSYDVTDVTDGNNDDGDNDDGDWNVDENITHVMSIAQQSWCPVGNFKIFKMLQCYHEQMLCTKHLFISEIVGWDQ